MAKKIYLLALILQVLLSVDGISLFDYFPGANGKGYKITWAHAVNSRQKLLDALKSDVMMLEADVCPHPELGPSVPIMAHPPVIYWDITLRDWLKIATNSSKGIKLDFKYLNVVAPSLEIIENESPEINYPLLLNADILVGPTDPPHPPLNATQFVGDCRKSFNESMLSTGWTTALNGSEQAYSTAMIDEMLNVLNGLEVTQAVTYPVRACFAVNSVDLMQRLLADLSGPNSNATLTVWSSENDPVTAHALASFHSNFSVQSVYYDLPSPLREQFIELVDPQ